MNRGALILGKDPRMPPIEGKRDDSRYQMSKLEPAAAV